MDKRYNKAMEELFKAKENFCENEVRQRDEAAKLRAEMANPNADISTTNKALMRLAIWW